MLAAEGIGAAAIESETMAEPMDLIAKWKRFGKTLICENGTIENSRERERDDKHFRERMKLRHGNSSDPFALFATHEGPGW